MLSLFVCLFDFNFPFKIGENVPFSVTIDITFAGAISQKLWRVAHANIAFWLMYFHEYLIIIDFFNIQLYNLLRYWGSFHHNRLLMEYWNYFLFITPQGVLPQYFTIYQRGMCNVRSRYLFRRLRCWLLSCFLKFYVFGFFFQHEYPSFSYSFWMSYFVVERGTFSVQSVAGRWIRDRSKLYSESMVIMLTSLS